MATYPDFFSGAILRGWQLRGSQIEVIESTNGFSTSVQSTQVDDPELVFRFEPNASYLVEATLLFRSTVDTAVGVGFRTAFGASSLSQRHMTFGTTASSSATNFVSANETRLSLVSDSQINTSTDHQLNNDSIDHVINKTVVLHTDDTPRVIPLYFFKGTATAGTVTRSPGSFMCITRFA